MDYPLNDLFNLVYRKYKAEGYAYFEYPELSYEEGLENVKKAVDNFTPYTLYPIDEIEEILKKLKTNPFTFEFFLKIKGILKENNVMLQATYGKDCSLGTYAEFRIDKNKVILNLATLLMDPKVEKEDQIGQIIVHELVHATVVYKTFRKSHPELFSGLGELSSLEKTAIDNLEYVYSVLLKNYGMREEYGIANLDEMLAELVNPIFVEKLKKVNVYLERLKNNPKQKTLFTVFINSIFRLITRKPLKGNAHSIIYSNYLFLAINNSLCEHSVFFREGLAKNYAKWRNEDKGFYNEQDRKLNHEDALLFRSIEFPLITKESEIKDKFKRLIAASVREDRSKCPELYDGYLNKEEG